LFREEAIPWGAHLDHAQERQHMRNIIYIVGLVVIVIAILSFVGLT